MHPLNSNDFGINGIKIVYNDGITTNITGHIVKQLGTSKYLVAPHAIAPANAASYVTVTLATTSAMIANLPANVGTILVTVPANANAVEHAMKISTRKLNTVEGNTYNWRKTTAVASGECNVAGDWVTGADASGFSDKVNV